MLRQREKLLMERLHQSFRRAESQLVSVLERRKGEVKVIYIHIVSLLIILLPSFLL